MRQPREPVNVRIALAEKTSAVEVSRAMKDAMRPRAVACFTFDNMAEAADVGTGRRDGPLPEGSDPSLVVGYPRLYALLARHDVRATFFVEGWNGVHHPGAVAEIVRRGHELGMHGWLHEPWATLDAATERALAARATAALTDASGVRPTGFRAPGGKRSAATDGILRGLGYAYDASLGDRMRPGRLASGLAQVPFVWPCVDGFHYLRAEPTCAAIVREQWLATLGQVAEKGGLFLVVCHAFLTGVDDARLAVLDDVMHAAVRDARVAICTAGEIAAGVAP
jgi:peptidoglycan/xylan/chitin deacetylase (PgdA/CDA1 family)